jgi:hypothetical protein
MYVSDNQLAIIRKRAIKIFIVVVFLGIIQISMFYFNIDRISRSVINMLIFWPLYVIVLFKSIFVVGYYIRHFKSMPIVYLLSTIPVFAFLIYFVRELIVTY